MIAMARPDSAVVAAGFISSRDGVPILKPFRSSSG
jgi:hypothetical protein